MATSGFFNTGIEYLKGIGPQRAKLLQKELEVFTYGDLLQHYPFRYEDRSKFYKILDLEEGLPYVQIKGSIRLTETEGVGRKRRLKAYFEDDTGEVELVWFRGIDFIRKSLVVGTPCVVFGKPTLFRDTFSIAHPEIEPYSEALASGKGLQPIYPLSEKLRNTGLSSRAFAKLTARLLQLAEPHIRETLPEYIRREYKLIDKKTALFHIHFPPDADALQQASRRLKFEELFYVQLRLLKQKFLRREYFPGRVFTSVPTVKKLYESYLPFELTDAQKRVIREIYDDLRSGKQMNRLLQGDVGSGKTIVAFIAMLAAYDAGTQSCLMAPTEILAEQHYKGLLKYTEALGIRLGILTGSTKKKEKEEIYAALASGELHMVVGTHALIEESVKFKDLGLCVIDEQHRFGVAQRASLWNKHDNVYPHILVMTATPIPRTLAMTLYGDLDVSVIDQLPQGRRPIKTVHRYESRRLEIFGFLKKEMAAGRQVYIVYPLIEESEKIDLKHLTDGYESVVRAFPKIPVSIVHGKMKPTDKDFEMSRFAKGQTKIMVATTVIEVGIDVPNASVMVIENADRFGLSQLHQLRGRVGRGAEQSYCILLTDYKLTKEARTRIETMVRTTDGFEIAETDLKLRGPGDMAGTRQSGVLDLLIADLSKDGAILQAARSCAEKLLEDDPKLEKNVNNPIRSHIESLKKDEMNWARVS